MGQMQDSYLDQRHYKPNPKEYQKIYNPQVILKKQANLHTGSVLGCYYSDWYNAPPKGPFQHPQNAYAQFGNEGLPNQQTGYHIQMPLPTLPENWDQTHIHMNNNNSSSAKANKLNVDDDYKHQHIETPSISQLPSQDESYRPRHIIITVPRQNQTITEDM